MVVIVQRFMLGCIPAVCVTCYNLYYLQGEIGDRGASGELGSNGELVKRVKRSLPTFYLLYPGYISSLIVSFIQCLASIYLGVYGAFLNLQC